MLVLGWSLAVSTLVLLLLVVLDLRRIGRSTLLNDHGAGDPVQHAGMWRLARLRGRI